jgi:hypothetical protein
MTYCCSFQGERVGVCVKGRNFGLTILRMSVMTVPFFCFVRFRVPSHQKKIKTKTNKKSRGSGGRGGRGRGEERRERVKVTIQSNWAPAFFFTSSHPGNSNSRNVDESTPKPAHTTIALGIDSAPSTAANKCVVRNSLSY